MASSGVVEREIFSPEQLERVDLKRVPEHVALIMDGNRRWARQNKQEAIMGHRAGIGAVMETVKAAVRLGVRYLTLYAFSTENWRRSDLEVGALMRILADSIVEYQDPLVEQGVRLQTIGDLSAFPLKLRKKMEAAIERSQGGSSLTLIGALNYGARNEIVRSVKKIAQDLQEGALRPEEIDERRFASYLDTAGIPDPQLMIRTGGEQRISNFLLWQLAYAELYSTSRFWPEFTRLGFLEAVIDYQKRERRMGR